MNRPGQPANPPQPKWVSGPVNRVPCPNCGNATDLRELQSQQLLDTGSRVTCDKCQRVMEVVGIQMVQVIAVRPWMGDGPQQPTLPVRQQKPPSLLRRLTGK